MAQDLRKIIQLYRNGVPFEGINAVWNAIYSAEGGTQDDGDRFIKENKIRDGEPLAFRYKDGDHVSTVYGIAYVQGESKRIELFLNKEELNRELDSIRSSISTKISNAINALDVTDTAVANQYVSKVSQTNGKIDVDRVDLPVIGVTSSDVANKVINTLTLSSRKVTAGTIGIKLNNTELTESSGFLQATINTDKIFFPAKLDNPNYIKDSFSITENVLTLDKKLSELSKKTVVTSVTGETDQSGWSGNYSTVVASPTSGAVTLSSKLKVTSSVSNTDSLITSQGVYDALSAYKIKTFKNNHTVFANAVNEFNVVNSLDLPSSSTQLTANSSKLVAGNNVSFRIKQNNGTTDLYIDSSYENTKYTGVNGIKISETNVGLEDKTGASSTTDSICTVKDGVIYYKDTNNTYTGSTGITLVNDKDFQLADHTGDGGTYQAKVEKGIIYYHDTNSHWKTSHVFTGVKEGTTNGAANSSAQGQGEIYLNILDDGKYSSTLTLRATGSTSLEAKEGVLTISSSDTNTHYTAKNVVSTSSTGTTNTSTTNSTTYLNLVENSAVNSSIKISGSGATTVKHTTDGGIVINSTDTNTEYTGSTGINITDTTISLNEAGLNKLGGVKTTSSVSDSSGYTAVPIIGGIPYYKDTYYTSTISITSDIVDQKVQSDEITDPWINLIENNVAQGFRLKGTGATTIKTDTDGTITINSTNTDHQYTAGNGLDLSNGKFSVDLNAGSNSSVDKKNILQLVGEAEGQKELFANVHLEETKIGIPTNVRSRHTLKSNGESLGYIDIPKDGSLKSVKLDGQELVFTYYVDGEQTEEVRVNLGAFLTESEFKDGLYVSGSVVYANCGHGLEYGDVKNNNKTIKVAIGTYTPSSNYMDDMLSVDSNGVHISNVIDCGTF